MGTMTALVRHGSGVGVRQVPRPSPGEAEVLVRVVVAGICRTDLHVAEGLLPAADPVVLGHEFAGVVEEVGPGVHEVRPGQRVAVMPVVPCGICAPCLADDDRVCLQPTMLGVDRDGAFADFVNVPAHRAHPLPDGLPWRVAAYAEPVAAALAVLHARLRRGQRGLIVGRNRFSELIWRILWLHGITLVTAFDPDQPGEPAGSFDFVIETDPRPEALALAVRAVRPRGVLVLRSRRPGLVPFDLRGCVLKELTLCAVNYAPFTAALDLLASGRLDLDGLLGEVFPLTEFEAAFSLARSSEASKLFLVPLEEHVRDR
jgi:L-iditol 2-dehydrogenase